MVHGLCQTLARSGYGVEALTSDAFDRERRRRAADNQGLAYPVHVLPNLSNRLAYGAKIFLPRGLDQWTAAHLDRFDVVHLHELRTPMTFRLGAACRRRGIPYVISGHGGFPHHGRWRPIKSILDRLWLASLLAGAARFVAASEFERGQLGGFGIETRRVEVLPHGLDLSEFADLPPRDMLRASLGLGQRPLVLFLGRLDAIKGILLLLKGFAEAKRGNPEAALVLAGPEGWGARELRRAAREMGVEEAVYWTGILPGRERLAALVDADLLCFPADRDCFGLAPFEALACGTPVVALSSGGSGEWLSRAGGADLVEADAGRLGSAILRVLSDPGPAREQARRAAAYVRAELAWDRIAPLYGALYASAAACAAGPQGEQVKGPA